MREWQREQRHDGSDLQSSLSRSGVSSGHDNDLLASRWKKMMCGGLWRAARCLPLWGRWQPEGLTEEVFRGRLRKNARNTPNAVNLSRPRFALALPKGEGKSPSNTDLLYSERNPPHRAFAMRRAFWEPLNKSSTAEQRIFCSLSAVWKIGNTYSIPRFSKLCEEAKSLAVGSCRINQSFLRIFRPRRHGFCRWSWCVRCFRPYRSHCFPDVSFCSHCCTGRYPDAQA